MRLLAPDQRARQRNGLWVALARQLLDRRTARIAEPEQLGGLVESLAQRIVDRGREAAIFAHPLDQQQLAMPARDEQQQIGEFERRIGQPRAQRVAFEVVDREQRLPARHRQRLGAHQADHHPADQAGPRGRGDRIALVERDISLLEHRRDEGREPVGMRARGDFGHHAAIGRMFLVLRGDPLRDDPPIAIDKRRGGLVATAFYP